MLSARIEPVDRDVEVLISDVLSPVAQSAALAEEARKQLKVGEEQNRSVLGRIPPHTTTVDGSANGDENQVKPDGVIVYEFDLATDLFVYIADQLQTHAPVGGAGDPHPGLYKKSFDLYADGELIEVGKAIPQEAREFVFINDLPYSRKIELGRSSQAPDGVFQAVALLARARFGNVARIEFNYRAPLGAPKTVQVSPRGTARARTENKSDNRYPAIVVSLR